MTLKVETKASVMSLPHEMYKNECDGELIVRISKRSQPAEEFVAEHKDRLTPEMEKAGITTEEVAGAFVVDMTIKVGDLTDNEIIGCSAEDFLKNGLVAAILDAIRIGLMEPRGINVAEAVEKAGDKAHHAKYCVDGIDVLDKLEGLMLAISEPEGEA